MLQPLFGRSVFRELGEEPQPVGEVAEDVVIVPRSVQGIHGLVGEEQVIGRRKDDVAPFQERGDRQDHVAEPGCGREEQVLTDRELDLPKRLHVLVDVAALGQVVAACVVDGPDVVREAAVPAVQDGVGPLIHWHGGTAWGRRNGQAAAARQGQPTPGVSPARSARNADVAGGHLERNRHTSGFLATDGALYRESGDQGRWLGLPVAASEVPNQVCRRPAHFLSPLRRLRRFRIGPPDVLLQFREARAVACDEWAIDKILRQQDVQNGQHQRGVRAGQNGDPFGGEMGNSP